MLIELWILLKLKIVMELKLGFRWGWASDDVSRYNILLAALLRSNQRSAMEPAGLTIGAIALASLFTDCIECLGFDRIGSFLGERVEDSGVQTQLYKTSIHGLGRKHRSPESRWRQRWGIGSGPRPAGDRGCSTADIDPAQRCGKAENKVWSRCRQLRMTNSQIVLKWAGVEETSSRRIPLWNS